MYRIVITRQVERVLVGLPTQDAQRILAAIQQLANTPRPVGTIKLTGSDLWRIRVGNYRVIYEINDTKLAVTVVRVGHRRDIYR